MKRYLFLAILLMHTLSHACCCSKKAIQEKEEVTKTVIPIQNGPILPMAIELELEKHDGKLSVSNRRNNLPRDIPLIARFGKFEMQHPHIIDEPSCADDNKAESEILAINTRFINFFSAISPALAKHSKGVSCYLNGQVIEEETTQYWQNAATAGTYQQGRYRKSDLYELGCSKCGFLERFRAIPLNNTFLTRCLKDCCTKVLTHQHSTLESVNFPSPLVVEFPKMAKSIVSKCSTCGDIEAWIAATASTEKFKQIHNKQVAIPSNVNTVIGFSYKKELEGIEEETEFTV